MLGMLYTSTFTCIVGLKQLNNSKNQRYTDTMPLTDAFNLSQVV